MTNSALVAAAACSTVMVSFQRASEVTKERVESTEVTRPMSAQSSSASTPFASARNVLRGCFVCMILSTLKSTPYSVLNHAMTGSWNSFQSCSKCAVGDSLRGPKISPSKTKLIVSRCISRVYGVKSVAREASVYYRKQKISNSSVSPYPLSRWTQKERKRIRHIALNTKNKGRSHTDVPKACDGDRLGDASIPSLLHKLPLVLHLGNECDDLLCS